jgi:ParB-like chromosome segregation protein Spo0J
MKIAINKIKPNTNNPRYIKDNKFKKLVQSIKEFPQMLKLRPIVVNSDMMVLGGNMRLKACKEAGLKDVYVKVASDLTEQQQKEFIIKDNVGFGDWDWDILANEWDTNDLDDWGLDVPKEPLPAEEFDFENEAWFLNIEFEDENEAQKWYEKLKQENLNIKIVQ